MTAVELSISEVNDLPSDFFIKIFGNVVEHYPPAAIGILKNRPFKDAESLAGAVGTFLDTLILTEKEKILQLHPDLAGKLAEAGNLTDESQQEQSSAGLDQITIEDKQRLNELNERYKSKFGFPFVICARENKFQAILTSMVARLENEKHSELNTGIEEVKKISKLRIYQIIK